MNNPLRTLTAVLALAAVVGCDKPEVTGEATTGTATNVPEAPDASPAQQQADPAPLAPPDKGTVAPSTTQDADRPESDRSAAAFDPRNASFSLDGRTVVLANGLSQVPAAPGSASSVTTRYLGKAAHGDLTGDGQEDLAYFVTREGGGSGRFYYVVAAVRGANGYKTTDAFLVGDRIDPQSLRIASKELHVTFLGRHRGEPMTAPPSRESVLLLKVTPDGVLEGLMR
jgi:hypothetical protein